MELDQLPIFEGDQPRTTELAFAGKSGRRSRPFHIGEEVVLVIEGVITEVAHRETKGGIARAHKVAVANAYELGADRAPDILETLAAEYQEALDGIEGRAALPFGAPGGDLAGDYVDDDEIPDPADDETPDPSYYDDPEG